MRLLLVTHRTVPLDRSDEYAAAWRRVTESASPAGANAWRFRRSGHDDRFVEFVEWQTPGIGPDDPSLAAALRELEEIAGGTTEELEEAAWS